MGDATHDAQLRVQPPAVHGQINIRGIIVRGQNHRRGLFQPRLHENLSVRRIADKDLVCDISDAAAQGLVVLDQVNGNVLLLERVGRGPSYLAAANDQHRVIVRIVDDQNGVELKHLLGGSRNHEHAFLRKPRLATDGQQPAPLPHRDDMNPDGLFQSDVAERAAHERRVVHGEIGDLEVADVADHMRLGMTSIDPTGEPLPEPLV